MEIYLPKRGDLLVEIPIYCRTKPHQRPRVSYKSKRVYQPKNTQKELLDELSLYGGMRIDQPIIVDCIFCFNEGSLIKKQIGDVDNLVKSIYDSLVLRKVITDDIKIVGGEAFKCLGTEDMTHILIYALSSDLTRKTLFMQLGET